MIAGLLAERDGYLLRGDDARVALVDEQLKHYGHTVDAAEKRAAGQGEDEQPKKRGPKPKATAEQKPKDET
jgi:hypothetical protein